MRAVQAVSLSECAILWQGGTELALYGRGDHMDFNAELTLEDRATMAARAAYLVAIFLPFFLLAPLLFLLANLLLRWDRPSSQPLVNGDRCVQCPGSLLLLGLDSPRLTLPCTGPE